MGNTSGTFKLWLLSVLFNIHQRFCALEISSMSLKYVFLSTQFSKLNCSTKYNRKIHKIHFKFISFSHIIYSAMGYLPFSALLFFHKENIENYVIATLSFKELQSWSWSLKIFILRSFERKWIFMEKVKMYYVYVIHVYCKCICAWRCKCFHVLYFYFACHIHTYITYS